MNLDQRVTLAARAMARAQGITLGEAISELALAGLEARSAPDPVADLVFLPTGDGPVITTEMVVDALTED